jgi:PhnB protein
MAVELGLSPYLVVSDAKAAIAFYQQAFGAVVESVHKAPHSDKVMHAMLRVHGCILSLSDDFPEFMGGKSRTPQALGGTPVTLHLQVADAEATWAQAKAAGATDVFPLKDQFWGERYGKLSDPFGHEWAIGQALRTVSDEETERAAEQYFKKEAVVAG